MLRRTRLSRLVIVVTGLTCLVTGCSGSEEEKPGVATLQSTPPSAAAVLADQRPVFPVDATDADREAMTRPWEDCLVKNGGPQYRGQGLALLIKGATDGEAVFKTCAAEQPETYEEHQQRTDLSEFKDNQREWYRCAKEAGYKLTAPDPETGQFGLTEIGPNGDAGSPKMQECKRKAFTG
ncbi:hypothetical protein [Nucisporomicrobium flavum]|uniref:hypothetical protein n=1 Tax=Nucisporomicrobium flavum TaxID=2785915 RepID=UPI0018F6AF7B|nr:hypothetical protein [Nucisporomicrobium flavum]